MGRLTDPRFMAPLMGALTIAFVVLIPVAHVTGLVHSIVFVNDLSLLALVLSAGAWWAAASVERRQADENVAEDVVERVVQETDVEREGGQPPLRAQGE